MAAIWLEGRILIVRQSYRSNPNWPGGAIRSGEDPKEAVARELGEELGLMVRPCHLTPAMETRVEWGVPARPRSNLRAAPPSRAADQDRQPRGRWRGVRSSRRAAG
ncbi:MAG: NUDIX hydrolase [Acetobacteraceae bacterium]|nr:NUDIX hydrolase [Acetobacteraceae bacterium]